MSDILSILTKDEKEFIKRHGISLIKQRIKDVVLLSPILAPMVIA